MLCPHIYELGKQMTTADWKQLVASTAQQQLCVFSFVFVIMFSSELSLHLAF